MSFRNSVVCSMLLLTALACDNAPSASAPATAEAPKTLEAPKLAPTASASAAPAESAAPERRPRRDRAGLAGAMYAAAAELELPADKKAALDKLDEGLGGGPADPEARKALNAAMTEGVKAGKVELAKLEPSLAELDKAAAARKEAEIKALDALHEELDAAQRKALVESVKKRQAEREARFKDRPEPGPDKVKDEERAKRRLERLTGELGLDADQQKKVEPILAKHDMGREGGKAGGAREEMRKRMDALLAAFEKDTFSAAKLDFGADAKHYREMAKKQAEYLNALLAVIKPEQRDKLAATLADRPGGPRGRGPWGPRPGRPMGGPMGGPPPAADPAEELEDD